MKLENYRHYLLSEFEIRKTRNSQYSLRAFARDLRTSPSRLSEALNGKRGISSKLADNFIKLLNLGDIDSEIFRLSVDAEHSRSKAQKQSARQKLDEILASSSEPQLKTYTIVDWIAEALLKMNERENIVNHVEKAAHRLDVPEFMVVNSLRFLTRLGFVTDTKKFKTYLTHRGQGRKLNVDYIQILEQARKAYSTQMDINVFYNESLLLEKKDVYKAKLIFEKAYKEIRKLESKSKKSKVYFISNQIFSIEKERYEK